MQGEYFVDESIEHRDLLARRRRADRRQACAHRRPGGDRGSALRSPGRVRRAGSAAPQFVLVDSFAQPTVAGEQTLSITVPLLASTRQVIRVALRGGRPVGRAVPPGTTIATTS
jgi:hypothetical protein